MAAKLLHSLADDNPDLQKQIGCMTGIFHLFDRQYALTGRRLTDRRLPPGESHFKNGSSERESFNVYHQPLETEMNPNMSLNERHRFSTESSRLYFSSSCSSVSSLDGNKNAQLEASSYDRIIFPETPSRDAVLTQPSTSPCLGWHSLEFRDVVKDSMYREARGLSVKTNNKEELVGHPVKHKDSPRPLQFSDGSYGHGKKGKQDASVDLKESLRVLAKLREAPWNYNDTRERPKSSYKQKEGSSYTMPKDAHRFSYDGRETNHLSFESRDTIKSTLKLKELPRLSLDSREILMRSANSDAKSSYISKDLQNGGNSQKRPPSVVAKLMGLEPLLPDSASAGYIQSGTVKSTPFEHGDSFPTSLKANDVSKPIRVPKSPRSFSKEPNSPRWKNPDLIMKPISRLPIEPAPWKQPEGSQFSQKPVKVLPKTPNPFPTVYSEIERRLKDLEFNQAGKDLRALKQILEAMQAKGLLDTTKEGSNFGISREYEPNCTSPGQRPRSLSQRNQHITSSIRSSDSLRMYESPIVIMKPAKLVDKSGLPASSIISIDSLPGVPINPSNGHAESKNRPATIRTAKDQSPSISHRESSIDSSDKKASVRNRSTPSSMTPQQSPKESAASSVKSSGSVSPRLQQKKLEFERRSRPPTPPSDSNKPRRQSNRMSTESASPGGKNGLKSHKMSQTEDQLSQISNESRTSSHQGDDVSLQSDITVVSDLKTDVDVNSAEQSSEVNDGHSPMKSSNHLDSVSKPKKPTSQSEDGTVTEFGVDTPEHPSPVSVLDLSVYRDDALSPVEQPRKSPEAGDGAKDSNNQQNKDHEDSLLFDSHKKLQNIDNLVKKLRRLNSTHDEASTDYIASLCENTNPDHRYISEILLASGLLLRDLDASMPTFQLHASGHPINPELFLVLEQTKASNLLSKEEYSHGKSLSLKANLERYHRKLIFDSVNEMIVKKLALMADCGEPWLKSDKLAKKTMNAQKLLKEVCLQIEELQEKKAESNLEEEDVLKGILMEDVMLRWEKWTDFMSELAGVVLDVERSIFKDLVDEIVIGGGSAAFFSKKLARPRQLFAK